jgi:outer membrane protein TolC
MRLNKKLFLTGTLVVSAFALHAQAVRHVSLQEAIDLSLKASRQLRVSDARLQQANASYTEAKERRLPDVSISGSYIRLAQPDIDFKLKLGSSNNTSGGTTGEQSAAAPPSVTQAAYVIANASLPLFAGHKIQNGIESAKYLAEASRLDADKDREEVVQNTINAYTNLFKATQAVKVVEEGLGQSRQRVKELGNLEKNGLLARNDLLKAELQQSNVELSLLDAQNNLHITNQNMNLMLGLPAETVIEPDTEFTVNAADHSLMEWETLALQNRKDAASLGYRAKAAEAGIRVAKGDYYPSVALTAGYIGAYVENVVVIKDAVNAGVGLSYAPSSLWKTGSKVAAAKARLAEVEANRGLLEDGIRLQIAQAYENYLLSKKKIDVYNTAMEQSAENFRIVHNKYENSLATTTELLDADVAQLQARLNFAFAKADAAVSYKKLLQTAGLLTADGTVAKP